MAAATDSFQQTLAEWPVDRIHEHIDAASEADVRAVLRAGPSGFSPRRLAALLSPHARTHLEEMAVVSAALTRQRFGRAIQFYAPLYVSNYCVNSCVYCGFNCRHQVNRRALSLDEAICEARNLADEGFEHLLLVSGEDPTHVPVSYFEELVRGIRDWFASLNVEIYPLSEAGYSRLVEAGVDSLTLYQETYDREAYARFHPAGPKHDFDYRLETIERGAQAGMAFLGIGALLGLTDWRVEGFRLGLHAAYLHRRYWRQHVSISFPRLRSAFGAVAPPHPVDDATLVQLLCALRLVLPDAGLVLSTRESAEFRDHALPLGITRVSAGSRTTPGGYTDGTDAEQQFEVQDHRCLRDVMAAVQRQGFDPVRKDWDRSYH